MRLSKMERVSFLELGVSTVKRNEEDAGVSIYSTTRPQMHMSVG